MTKGPNERIYILMPKEFEEVLVRIRDLNIDKKTKNLNMTRLAAATVKCKIDSQWRVKIPDKLAEYAGIEKAVKILGTFSKIELWNPDKCAAYIAIDEKGEEEFNFDDFATDLFIEGRDTQKPDLD